MRNKTKKINLSLRDQTTMNWPLESSGLFIRYLIVILQY
jgi:hypothetical protein